MPQYTVIKDDPPKSQSAKGFAKMIGTTPDDFIVLLLQGVEKHRRGEIQPEGKETTTCGKVV